MSRQNVEVIDLYHGYQVMGSFSQVKKQNIDEFLLKHPEGQQ